MRTRQTRAAAATGLLHADGSAWKTEGAPASNEVIWANVATPANRRWLGGMASWAILISIMVFFLPIIAGLQQLVNLEGYAKPGNWAEWLMDAPVLGSATLLASESRENNQTEFHSKQPPVCCAASPLHSP